MTSDFLHALAASLRPENGRLVVPWPGPRAPGGLREFAALDDWTACLAETSLAEGVPEIVATKYRRAQKLFLLAWIDPDLLKAGELVAFTALELALVDCYGAVVKPPAWRKPNPASNSLPTAPLAAFLDYLVSVEGLTDDHLPSVRRSGGSVVERLRVRSSVRPTIAEMRNEACHGFPFDGMPIGGLLELIRDLIHFGYRNRIQTAPTVEA